MSSVVLVKGGTMGRCDKLNRAALRRQRRSVAMEGPRIANYLRARVPPPTPSHHHLHREELLL